MPDNSARCSVSPESSSTLNSLFLILRQSFLADDGRVMRVASGLAQLTDLNYEIPAQD